MTFATAIVIIGGPWLFHKARALILRLLVLGLDGLISLLLALRAATRCLFALCPQFSGSRDGIANR